MGGLFGLTAFVCVAMGGFGSMSGALLAALTIGLVEAFGGFYIAPVFKYVVVRPYLVVIMFKPKGFLMVISEKNKNKTGFILVYIDYIFNHTAVYSPSFCKTVLTQHVLILIYCMPAYQAWNIIEDMVGRSLSGTQFFGIGAMVPEWQLSI